MDADAAENASNHPNNFAVTLREQHFSRVFGGTAEISQLPMPILVFGKDGERSLWAQSHCYLVCNLSIYKIIYILEKNKLCNCCSCAALNNIPSDSCRLCIKSECPSWSLN